MSAAGGARAAWAAAGVLFLALALSFLPYRPPQVAASTAAEGEFSAARAREHLEHLARQAHPPGAADHERVRQYLLAQIRSLGLEPDVQTLVVTSTRRLWNVAASVHNVAARLRGTGDGSAVLLVAHYDSVAGGPGASDDAAAVAALLETLRALRTRQPLRNDVIVLFTDAEEDGLLGAEGFAGHHEWMRDARLVLNFEARGTRGPSLMFETGAGNSRLVEGLRAAVAHPVASSLFYEIYRRLPNDTDFTVFRRAGLPGMNFAYLDGLSKYHTKLDSLDALDPRSLQHHGEYALGLARYFGSSDLEQRADGPATFFTLPLAGLVSYGNVWVVPLSVGSALLVVAALLVRWRRDPAFSLRRIALAGLLMLAAVAVTALVAELIWLAIATLDRTVRWMPLGEPYHGSLYMGALALVAAATWIAAFAWLRKRFEAAELFDGALLLWTLATLALTFLTPGAAYLMAWPVLFGAIGALFLPVRRASTADARSLILCGTLGMPAVILLAPMIWLLYLGLTVAAATVLAALIAFTLCMTIPLIELIVLPGRSWRVTAIPVASALAVLLITALSAQFSAKHPRPESLFYVDDASGARWVSSDRSPSDWTARFLGPMPVRAPLREQFGALGFPFLSAPAPHASGTVPPGIEEISRTSTGEDWSIELRIRSARDAEQLWVSAVPRAQIVSASVNGEPLRTEGPALAPWTLRYTGLPREGISLVLRIHGPAPVLVRALDRTSGLPQLARVTEYPRPPHSMPSPMFDELQDATFIGTSATFQRGSADGGTGP